MFGVDGIELLVRVLLLAVLLGAALKRSLPVLWALLYALGTNVVPLLQQGLPAITTPHNLGLSAVRWVVCSLYLWMLVRRDADVVFWLIFFFGFALVLI